MKTTDAAIDAVFKVLNGTITPPVYKQTKRTDLNLSEYVVIGALPVTAGVLQRCSVNVNYHVKNIYPGAPDTLKLYSNTTAIMDLLKKHDLPGIMIDFERQQYIPEEALDQHYSNIRFSVKLINN